MKFSDAVNGYIICKSGNRIGDLSPKTLRLYQHILGKVSDEFGDKEISDISLFDLELFMGNLAKPERGLSTSSQHNYYKAIRSLWKWANETLKIEPIQLKLRPPIVHTEPVIPFSKTEIEKIIKACEYTTRTSPKSRKLYKQSRATEIRDKAIIYLLLDTGLRIGELSRLTLADISFEYGSLQVTAFHSGKKSRPREVPFGRTAKRYLWQYITENDIHDKIPLFGLTIIGLTRLFARIGERAKVPKVHAHRFRHTFAIQFLRNGNNGNNLFSLQLILGHADIEMCKRYLAIATADVKRDHNNASPVDNWNL